MAYATGHYVKVSFQLNVWKGQDEFVISASYILSFSLCLDKLSSTFPKSYLQFLNLNNLVHVKSSLWKKAFYLV